MATGLGLQLAADYGTIDKDTPSYNPMKDIQGVTLIDGANFLSNTAGDPVAIVIGSHESNYTEPFKVTSRVSIEVGLPQPVVQEFSRMFWLAVALAPYRSVKKWGQSGVKLEATVQGRKNEYWRLAGNNTAPDYNSVYVSSQSTQEHMDACWKAESAHWWTSKQLTDALVRYDDTEAVKFCRTVKVVNGGATVAMDLPNIDCLMRVYQARQYIDSKDPTLKVLGSTYKKLSLTQWFPDSAALAARVYFAWSSSPLHNRNAGGGWIRQETWFVSSTGQIDSKYPSNESYPLRNTVGGVIPILEIPVT